MKVAVITAMVGNVIPVPEFKKQEGCDYFMVTDQKIEHDVWEIVKPSLFSEDDQYRSRRACKIYKCIPEVMFSGYDMYIWHDICCYLKAPISRILEELGSNDFAFFKHRERDCLYQEALECMGGRDSVEKLQQQTQHYNHEGMPKNWSLLETTSYVKKPSEFSTKIGMAWYEQICRFSSRDQISLPYVLWRNKAKWSTLPGKAQFRFHDKSSNDLIPSMHYTMHSKGLCK